MRFIYIIITLFASLALAAPAPVDAAALQVEAEPDVQAAEYDPNADCSARNIHCGKCNGTSCKIGLTNYPCDEGSCVAQNGGGDGKGCYDNAYDTPSPRHILCPGRR
ncbi:hypothetical protein ASPACDRAFT_45608 [Aspergillus aculeatus ATCC 16872]|uniref:Uncharacterized protein n=1 Tax=Aspergillus aculeatus (strain ATCC 16872 / CBS 172.66 / WB 5094) TaxID=690307 RepID=A0A1L9WMX7_ASPA1|nr:uncharacterized protein ASPACDRAFT_45608 [Aspergillus aculeatus ATCC 16872]OJJ97514.1 hypothetical protein ASPACDRAFT_45608 [Aspergillus aculeatus ATCC 16872]